MIYFVCISCAVFRPATVRQLITHAIMLGGEEFCGHASVV